MNIVVIGGGTGIYPVVTALQQMGHTCTCIINATDSGGSTGRIRDEFGFPPVGDLRQSLAALADPESQASIRQLLLYRFTKGNGIKGHNVGNLILTALQDITGSTTAALETAAQIFRITGTVIPVTEDDVSLQITYQDGTVLNGEHELDDSSAPHQAVRSVKLVPSPTPNPAALAAINRAQAVIIGPGDLRASLQAVLLVPGISTALQQTICPIFYFVNLMTRASQTYNMSAQEHVAAIETSVGRSVISIINDQEIPEVLLSSYAREDEFPVQDDLEKGARVLRAPLLSSFVAIPDEHDVVKRSLLRHDPQRIASILQRALNTTVQKEQ